MKNLNEMGVQEMDAKEMREENGGFLGAALLLFGAGYAIGRWIGGNPLW